MASTLLGGNAGYRNRWFRTIKKTNQFKVVLLLAQAIHRNLDQAGL